MKNDKHIMSGDPRDAVENDEKLRSILYQIEKTPSLGYIFPNIITFVMNQTERIEASKVSMIKNQILLMRTLKAIIYNRQVTLASQSSIIMKILMITLMRDVPDTILAPDDDIIKVKTQAGHLIWQLVERLDFEHPRLRFEIARILLNKLY